jgi:hypothetical protein
MSDTGRHQLRPIGTWRPTVVAIDAVTFAAGAAAISFVRTPTPSLVERAGQRGERGPGSRPVSESYAVNRGVGGYVAVQALAQLTFANHGGAAG